MILTLWIQFCGCGREKKNESTKYFENVKKKNDIWDFEDKNDLQKNNKKISISDFGKKWFSDFENLDKKYCYLTITWKWVLSLKKFLDFENTEKYEYVWIYTESGDSFACD